MTDDTFDQDQLRDLAARTAQLPREIDPPAEAWAVIEAVIRSPVEAAAHAPASKASPVNGGPSQRNAAGAAFWQRPVFLAAATLLLVAGSSAITAIAIDRRSPVDSQRGIVSVPLGATVSESIPLAGSSAPPSALPSAPPSTLAEFTMIENDYIGTANRLSAMLESDQMQLSPRTLAKMKESLRVIDAAILEARRALAEDPANRQLVEILSTTYSQKIDFLRRTTEMGRS